MKAKSNQKDIHHNELTIAQVWHFGIIKILSPFTHDIEAFSKLI